jgi:hypothetical protein
MNTDLKPFIALGIDQERSRVAITHETCAAPLGKVDQHCGIKGLSLSTLILQPGVIAIRDRSS